jgi:hypothetical protein
MLARCANQPELIRPDFNRAIRIDFPGGRITSAIGFLPLREMDERFRIIEARQDCPEDLRSPTHTQHAWAGIVQIVRGYMILQEHLNNGE